MIAPRDRHRAKAASPPLPPEKTPAESIKETIDSIIIALALALVFRAFIVEAFVIPTGSMAATLFGEHRHFTCDRCGREFDLGVDSRKGVPTDPQIRRDALFCPNCGWKFASNRQLEAANNPDRGGDKILVFKFPYIFAEPQRWDVVVFYNPANPDENFIKRLIGRPGETVQILDGDIYVGQVGQGEDKMQVQRKPALVQQALWRPVYINDFLPAGREKQHASESMPTWGPQLPASGWQSNARTFHYRPAGPATSGPDRVLFHPDRLSFLDYSAYNQYPDRNPSVLNVVWDLRLEFAVFFRRAGGRVAGSLNHRIADRRAGLEGPLRDSDERFTARFSQDGAVELIRTRGGADEVVGSARVAPFPLNGGVTVAIQNVDYRASVFVADREVLRHDRTPNLELLRDNEPLPRRKGLPDDDLPAVWIEGGEQPLELRHVAVHRDVYYTTWMGQDVLERIERGAPGCKDPNERIIALLRYGADGRDDPNDEFFVMGDNSAASSDGRVWSSKTGPYWHLRERIDRGLYRYGRVPRDHLIGQAFFVYWPAAFGQLPVGLRGLRYIPNVGRMRLIH